MHHHCCHCHRSHNRHVMSQRTGVPVSLCVPEDRVSWILQHQVVYSRTHFLSVTEKGAEVSTRPQTIFFPKMFLFLNSSTVDMAVSTLSPALSSMSPPLSLTTTVTNTVNPPSLSQLLPLLSSWSPCALRHLCTNTATSATGSEHNYVTAKTPGK